MSKIKALVFDLGKVVFDLSFDRVFLSWATSSGKQFAEIKSKFNFDENFEMFERNEITASQFRDEVSKRLEINLSDEDFDKGWCDLYLDKYAGIDNILAKLKKSYKLVALTNTNAIHNGIWRKKYSNTLSYFENIFSSHELGSRKPENKIYQIVLDYLQLNPEQTIFLDDNIENIKAAKKLGMQATRVTSFEQMKSELKNIGLVDEF